MKYKEEIEHVMAALRVLPTDFLWVLNFNIGLEIQQRSDWVKAQIVETEKPKTVKLHIVKEE